VEAVTYPFEPDWTLSPGHMLAVAMNERNIAFGDLTDMTGLDPDVLNSILERREPVTEETAAALGRALGSTEYWLNSQAIYEADLARGATDKSSNARGDDTAQPAQQHPSEVPWLCQLRSEVRRRVRAQASTRGALAAYLGITPKHMSQVLTGKVNGSPELLDRIAEAVGLRIVIAVGGESVPLPLALTRGRKRAKRSAGRSLPVLPPEGGTFPIDQFGHITADGEPVGGWVTFTPAEDPESLAWSRGA
jgi:plasmid maintenance system antidote protein VapI